MVDGVGVLESLTLAGLVPGDDVSSSVFAADASHVGVGCSSLQLDKPFVFPRSGGSRRFLFYSAAMLLFLCIFFVALCLFLLIGLLFGFLTIVHFVLCFVVDDHSTFRMENIAVNYNIHFNMLLSLMLLLHKKISSGREWNVVNCREILWKRKRKEKLRCIVVG